MGVAVHHRKFLIAFGVGLLVGLICWVQGLAWAYCLLAAANVFFLLYLALMAWLAMDSGPEELRRHAADDDEGVLLIVLLASGSVLASITAILLVQNADASSHAARLLALASLPLGWATIHVLAAFRYAHLYYRSTPAKGMAFPGKEAPDALDFLYASFTIGMAAQVSDVAVTTRPMRLAVLVHGVASFFYNTCILALAINAAVTVGI